MRNNDILNFIAPCLNGELSEALSGGEILLTTGRSLCRRR